MIETYVQIEFFETEQLVDEEFQIKEKARRYTASNIFQCSSHRDFVRIHLESGDMKSALREFDDCFRNYGFSNKYYSFNTYCGDGNIKVKGQFEFNVTSRELFADLLILWKEGLQQAV